MFMPLNIKNAAGNTLWIEPSPASSTSCRPLSIIMGKETDVYLKDHYKLIEEERIQLRNNPLQFLVNGADVTMKVNIKTSMIDGKMRGILSGLGGAFCLLCTCTRDEAVELDTSFAIDRSSEDIKTIWDRLHSGQMRRKAHD